MKAPSRCGAGGGVAWGKKAGCEGRGTLGMHATGMRLMHGVLRAAYRGTRGYGPHSRTVS